MERVKSSLDYIFNKITQKWTVLGVLGVVAILSWVAIFARAESGQLKVYFFSVGQGDAIFIELPDGRQILIDGGANDKVVEKLNEVMPFWDRTIDIIIATHADADHITGLVPVLEHYDVDVIIWNGIEAQSKIFKKFSEAMEDEGSEVLVGRCCMRLTLSDFTFFEILYPPLADASFSQGGGMVRGGQNDYSLVVRLVYGNDSFIFTGDIERRAEYKIMEQNLNIDSDILKVAHHGSKTSSSELFLEKVSPETAVISVGRKNSYGHPHEAILQRLAKYGIEIRRTDVDGDILLLSNGNSF